MKKWPKPRNPYAVSARFRKAGAHSSTNKRRGGKRGGSEATDDVEERLEELEDIDGNEEEAE